MARAGVMRIAGDREFPVGDCDRAVEDAVALAGLGARAALDPLNRALVLTRVAVRLAELK